MILCAAEDSPSSDVKLHSNPNSIPDIPSNTSSLGNDKEKKNNNNIVYFGQDDAPAIPQVTNDRTTLDQRIGQECTETGKVHGCDEQASFTTVKSVKKRLRSEDNVNGIATTLVPSLSLFSPESKNTLEPVVKAHRAEAKRIATISDKKNSDIPYDLPKIPPLERHIDSAYERIRCIGEGSYGSVYLARAKHSPTPKHVAIKILKRLESRNHGFEGFPITSIREIRILRYLATARKHAPKLANRVVRLEEVLSSHDLSETALIFEFMEYDLYKVLAFPTQLPEAVIALYTGQLLEGLSFIHQRCIMHRDLKSSNVLLNSLGELKLADFGMAREWRRDAQQIPMTPRVATLWYRAPELLLQRPNYNESVDIWSCGCIFAEMFLCRPLFRVIRDSKSQERSHRAEIAQLHCIFDTLGTPLETEWPDFAQHVQSIGMMVPDPNPNRLHEYMMEHSLVKPSEPALDLLSKMLSLAPKSRPSALELLKHLYFYQPEWMDRDSVQKQLRHKLERHSYCSSGFTLTLSSRNSSTHAGSSVDGRGCSKSSSNPNMTHRYAYSGHLVHSHSQVEPAASRPNAALHFTGNHRSRGGMLTPNGNRNQPVPIGRRHNSMKCTTSLPPDGLNHSRACPSIVPQNNMLDVRKISLGSVQPPSNIPFGGNSSALPPENSNNSSPSSQSGSKLRLTIGRMRAHDRIMTCQDVHERKVNEHDWLDHEVAKIVKDQNCGGSSSATYIPGGDGMGSQQNSVRNSLLEPFRGPNENMSTNPEHIDSQIDMPIKAMSSSNVACSPIKKNEQLSFRLRMTPRPLGGPCARPESKPQTNVSK